MKLVNKTMEWVVVILFVIMLVVGTLQVINRFFLNESLSWSEELQRYAFIWLVFIAIPITYNRKGHLCVDSISNLFPKVARAVFDTAVDLLWLAFGAGLAILTLQIMKVTQFQETPGLGLSMSVVYSGLLIGGIYQVLCVLHKLYTQFSNRAH